MNVKRIQPGLRMSAGTVYNGILHISGQVADDRKASLEVQVQQVLKKIDEIIDAAGGDKSGLLAINIYLPHIGDFDAMNAIYDNWVDKSHLPARACVETRLADADLRVEMTATCAIPD